MPDIIATNLAGKKVTETYKGVLHFDTALGTDKKPVYDGAGTKICLNLGKDADGAIIQGDLQVMNDLVVSSDATIVSNLSVGGDVSLIEGGSINNLTINKSGDIITCRALNTSEVGKLRIRESNTDFELIFGSPNDKVSNLFSIIVKKDGSNNLYIKNNYGDPDVNAPLWINRATGEVNIKQLTVNSFDIRPTGTGGGGGGGGGLYPSGGVMMFAAKAIPDGWLECDGRKLSINLYRSLYSVIGDTYNTLSSIDKNTEFQIPDMRGLFVRGWDTTGTVDKQTGRGFGTTQNDEFKSHTHTVTDPGHFHYIDDTADANTGTTEGGGLDTRAPNQPPGRIPNKPYTDNVKTNITIDNAGTGEETRPKNIALLYCIKT